jgi:2-desacetyl-2-hydroxyethyl bacteriochlorophyllide A dehydrogenase
MAAGATEEGTRVCWPEQGRAELAPFTVPDPKPDEVLIRTEVTIISPGTERAFFLGLPNAETRFPYYPGYSSVGRVIAHGEAGTRDAGGEPLGVGDRVATGAGHASHAVARAERCWKVPDGLAPDEAVYFSLGSIALQGVRKARLELGEPALVLGLGLVGNLALQLARLQGAFPVIGLDLDGSRREIAARCGADLVLDPSAPGTTEALAGATDGRGPSVVIEATGSAEAVNEALALAGTFARVVLLASTRGVTETNFYRDIHKKGLTVHGAHASTVPPHDSSPGFWTRRDDTRMVLRLLAGGRLQVGPLTSESFPAREAPRAYALLASWRKDVLGMLLRWQE